MIDINTAAFLFQNLNLEMSPVVANAAPVVDRSPMLPTIEEENEDEVTANYMLFQTDDSTIPSFSDYLPPSSVASMEGAAFADNGDPSSGNGFAFYDCHDDFLNAGLLDNYPEFISSSSGLQQHVDPSPSSPPPAQEQANSPVASASQPIPIPAPMQRHLYSHHNAMDTFFLPHVSQAHVPSHPGYAIHQMNGQTQVECQMNWYQYQGQQAPQQDQQVFRTMPFGQLQSSSNNVFSSTSATSSPFGSLSPTLSQGSSKGFFDCAGTSSMDFTETSMFRPDYASQTLTPGLMSSSAPVDNRFTTMGLSLPHTASTAGVFQSHLPGLLSCSAPLHFMGSATTLSPSPPMSAFSAFPSSQKQQQGNGKARKNASTSANATAAAASSTKQAGKRTKKSTAKENKTPAASAAAMADSDDEGSFSQAAGSRKKRVRRSVKAKVTGVNGMPKVQKLTLYCTYPGCETPCSSYPSLMRHFAAHKWRGQYAPVRCEACQSALSNEFSVQRHIIRSQATSRCRRMRVYSIMRSASEIENTLRFYPRRPHGKKTEVVSLEEMKMLYWNDNGLID
ncbi:hypothetical protein BGZ94_002875 [Podila epigama]|nr:hypothetical protein BGZ94_002875 [Podila epigama]